MPELPEIASRARQMNTELTGKQIVGVEVLQPKCLNIPQEDFTRSLCGATIQEVSYHGKWIFSQTTQGWLLINLGMGGEILLVTRGSLPDKYRLIFDFSDGTCLAINFWWFGSAHYAAAKQLPNHKETARLGPNALDLSRNELAQRISGKKMRVKQFLLNQENIAGIGNAYIHDILFLAHLHPLRTLNTLSETDIDQLAEAIQAGLRPSLEKNGAFYEVDLHGWNGSFTLDDILIGYKEGKPCPVCGAPITKIKTGSTTSFICPACQPLN